MLFMNPVRTSKRTPHFTITEINWLTLFKEMVAVYSENHAKPINTKCSFTDCQNSCFILLPLGPKGLNRRYGWWGWGFVKPLVEMTYGNVYRLLGWGGQGGGTASVP
jgi:hypothetical protein